MKPSSLKYRLCTVAVMAIAAVFLFAACAPAVSVPEPTAAPTPEPTAAPTAAPTPQPTPEPTIDPLEAFRDAAQQSIDVKLEALKSKDVDLYLSTVTQSDEYYFNEQGRWFTEMTKDGIKQIGLEITDVALEDETTAVATIHQTHYNKKEAFNFTYPLLYKKEDGQWKDCGYDFEEIETPRYTLKYQEGETRVDEFKEMIDIAYDNLEQIFTERPDADFEIKLFCDREMLRQRTVPSIGWLFTGWGEPNESLKIYTGHPTFEGYNGTLQHELVHHIMIRACNNNLPGWIHEGIALYYGNAQFEHSKSTTLSNLNVENIGLTIAYLETMDLYNPESQQAVWDWYNASYMYVGYIVETYGHDTLMEIFYEAGKKPFHDSVMNDTFEEVNNQTMGEVFSAVLGLTKEELTDAYLEWLEAMEEAA